MASNMYYDRDGNAISMRTWSEMTQADHVRMRAWESGDLDEREEPWTNKRVGDTNVGELRVSTVWLGLNHAFGPGPPLIFETMVFGLDDGEELMFRYSTLEEAEAGHLRVVNRLVALEKLGIPVTSEAMGS